MPYASSPVDTSVLLSSHHNPCQSRMYLRKKTSPELEIVEATVDDASD